MSLLVACNVIIISSLYGNINNLKYPFPFPFSIFVALSTLCYNAKLHIKKVYLLVFLETSLKQKSARDKGVSENESNTCTRTRDSESESYSPSRRLSWNSSVYVQDFVGVVWLSFAVTLVCVEICWCNIDEDDVLLWTLINHFFLSVFLYKLNQPTVQ